MSRAIRLTKLTKFMPYKKEGFKTYGKGYTFLNVCIANTQLSILKLVNLNTY